MILEQPWMDFEVIVPVVPVSATRTGGPDCPSALAPIQGAVGNTHRIVAIRVGANARG
jgi:hypothetical protein